jgi:antirestriction protein ArdC
MYYNLYTKQTFSGKNLEKLEATNLKGGFCTFNQARKLGGKVIKGSKAVTKLSRMITEGKENEFRSYSVFHQSQIQFNKEAK